MEVRRQNALCIMKDIECFPGITIAEIAKNREVSVSTVSNIVNILKAGDIIAASGVASSSGGRRPVLLTLNAGYQAYLGISIGKHTVYIAEVDFAGEILRKERFYLDYTGSDEYWGQVYDLAAGFTDDFPGKCRTGIALPGFVDREEDVVRGTGTLGEPEIRLADIRAKFGEEISVGDAGMRAGLAQTFGKADYPDCYFLLLSRRISGFLIRGGEADREEGSRADVGAMILDPYGKTNSYGIPGSFLELCSSSRIIDLLKQRSGETSYESFFEAVRGGNEEYREIWDEYLGHLAAAIHNLWAVSGTDTVIGGEMAGYLSEYGKDLMGKISSLGSGSGFGAEIRFSSYGKYDDAYGAALAARHRHVVDLVPSLMQDASLQPVRRKRRRAS